MSGFGFGKQRALPQVQGVGAGQRTTITVPTGKKSYDSIHVELTNVTKAQVHNLQINVGSKPILMLGEASRLESINKFYTLQEEAGVLNLVFYREHLINPAEAQLYVLGVADAPVVQIAFDIDAAAVNPAVSCYGLEGDEANIGIITKTKEIILTASAAGILEVDNIPRTALIQAIHLFSAVVTDAEVEADGVVQWQKASVARMQEICKRAGRTPQANVYHIDFMRKNAMGTQLVAEGLADLRLRLTTSGAGSIPCVIEYQDGYYGI